MSTSYNEQFKMSRMPIKPLAYNSKDLAQTRELLIDYEGENPTYDIYITDPKDRTKLINITQIIINQGFPTINGDLLQINIDGKLNTVNLKDIIDEIYTKYLFPDNKDGFNKETDEDKIFDPNTKNILLTDKDGNIYLPITSADNVYTNDGFTLQSKLDSLSKVGFSTSAIRAKTDNQIEFDIEYPFKNYISSGNYFELRIGSTFIDKSRYSVDENEPDSNGDILGAKITLIDQGLEIGRAINILFIYNVSSTADIKVDALSGAYIANGTVTTAKLEKITDNFDMADPTSVASAKSVYNLYQNIQNIINNTESLHCIYTSNINISGSKSGYVIKIDLPESFELSDGCKINIRSKCKLNAGMQIQIENSIYDIYDSVTGVETDYIIPENKLIHLIYSKSENVFYIESQSPCKISTNRWVYTAQDAETAISYSGLQYDFGDQIFAYKNGNRLFESIDYNMDVNNEIINMFTRSETGDKFVFESYNIERR